MKRIALIALGAAGLTLAACNNNADKTEAEAAADAGMDAAATAPADTSGGAMAPADGATGAASSSGSGAPAAVAPGSGSGTTTINGQVTNSAGQQAQGGTAPVGATLRGDSPGTATPLPAGQGTTYSRTNDQ